MKKSKKDLQRITKHKPFTNKYNWEEINFPLEKGDLKNKKAAIDPANKKYNKCFQYAPTVALNHEEIGKYS